MLLLGRSSRNPLQDYLTVIERTIGAQMEYRRNGSVAVSLMTVAQGRAEGCYEAHLKSWDAVAEVLIIREAGGHVQACPVPEMLEQGSRVLAVTPGLEAAVSDHIFSAA